MNKRIIGYLLLLGIGGFAVWKYVLGRRGTATGQARVGNLNFPLVGKPGNGNNVNGALGYPMGNTPNLQRQSAINQGLNAATVAVDVLPAFKAIYNGIANLFRSDPLNPSQRTVNRTIENAPVFEEPNWSGSPTADPWDMYDPGNYQTAPFNPNEGAILA